MKFQIGPHIYALAISNRAIFDTEGERLEAAAVENRKLIIISHTVEPERREEVALHEIYHCWTFHVPRPKDDEEAAQLTAFISQQFHRDLESQGGREALMQLPPRHVPHLGQPAPTRSMPLKSESIGVTDRMPCATCEADVMCGSINSGEPTTHEATGIVLMERWFECDACGSVQAWCERCTPDGLPLGEFVASPRPKVLRGVEAAKWLVEHLAAHPFG